MNGIDLPVAEEKRIEALKKYGLLDTPADGAFDRITQLAAAIFKVPVAIISLVDTDRIWFKSHHGVPVRQIGRDPGLCASAILSNDIYEIKDACKDPRSLANPLVTSEFGLRFYAAMPLQTGDQHNLGTLCIIDKVPRTLTAEEREILRQLARVVMDEMELRLELRETVSKVQRISSDLSYHLDEAINNLAAPSGANHKEQVVEYLEAVKMYLHNIDHQLEQL